jgi:methionyl-tRNA formyltransferase
VKIAIIGRTEILYETAVLLHKSGHDIAIIVTSKEAPEYTRQIDDFKGLATEWKVPFVVSSRISEHIDLLSSINADIGISINYTSVIPHEVINLFALGILNAHGGDLPRYRGNACQAWAIINGEDKIGLCVHKMIGGELDSGDILSREYLPIDDNTKITEVLEWVTKKTPFLFLDALSKLEENPQYYLERQSKDPGLSLRCYPRLPEDGRINWNQPALNIRRLINASNKPYSGAYCSYNEDKLIIWDATGIEYENNICAVPGQILYIGSNFVDVACSVGVLRITSVEYKQNMTTPDMIIRSIRKRLL